MRKWLAVVVALCPDRPDSLSSVPASQQWGQAGRQQGKQRRGLQQGEPLGPPPLSPIPLLAVLFVHQRWCLAVLVFQRLGYVGNGHRGILTPGTWLIYQNVGVGEAPIAGLFSVCESSSSIIFCLTCLFLFPRSWSAQIDLHFMKKIPPGAEASNVLVGELEFLDRPVVAFVRLAPAVLLNGLAEVPITTR